MEGLTRAGKRLGSWFLLLYCDTNIMEKPENYPKFHFSAVWTSNGGVYSNIYSNNNPKFSALLCTSSNVGGSIGYNLNPSI
jgi:hypothetical protein